MEDITFVIRLCNKIFASTSVGGSVFLFAYITYAIIIIADKASLTSIIMGRIGNAHC